MGEEKLIYVPKELTDAEWVGAVRSVLDAKLPSGLTNQLLERLCSIYQRPRMYVAKNSLVA